MAKFSDLEKWYKSQCDRDWEHGEGIRIFTFDNPGWGLEIELTGTVLEEKNFEDFQMNTEFEDDYLFCKKIYKGRKVFFLGDVILGGLSS